MPAATKDLTIEVGARYELRLTWMVGPSDARVAQDLAGAKAYMQIRRRVGDTVLLELTSDADEIFLGESAGLIRAVITPAQSQALAGYRRAKYDLLIELNGDPEFRERVLEGKVTINPAITVPAT